MSVTTTPAEACDRLIALHQAPNPDAEADHGRRHDLLRILTDLAQRRNLRTFHGDEDPSWRRRSGRPGDDGDDSGKNDGNFTGKRPTRPVFKCRGGHTLTRFQTPSSSYTCDVCRVSQEFKTTLHGCRICNWDACVPCYTKAMAELEEQFNLEEAARQKIQAAEAAPLEELPPNTNKAVYACLELFKGEPEALKDVFTIVKSLASSLDFRTKELRTRVALTINEACLKDTGACKNGCAALHNLCARATDISNEEAAALVYLANTIMAEHSEFDDVMEKLVGFVTALHDACAEARRLLLEANLVPVLLVGVSIAETPQKLKERDCAVLLRLLNTKTVGDPEQVMTVMEDCVRLHGDNDALCEQAFGVAMSIFGGSNHDPDLLLNQVTRLVTARFHS